jgi:hypothetical protein
MNQLSVTELVKLQNAYSTVLNESHEFTSEFGYSHDEDYDETNRPHDEFQRKIMKLASSPEFEDYILKVTFDSDETLIEFNEECDKSVFNKFWRIIWKNIIEDSDWELDDISDDDKFIKYKKPYFKTDYSGQFSDRDWEDAISMRESEDYKDKNFNGVNDFDEEYWDEVPTREERQKYWDALSMSSKMKQLRKDVDKFFINRKSNMSSNESPKPIENCSNNGLNKKLNDALWDILDNQICYNYPRLSDDEVDEFIEFICDNCITENLVDDLGIRDENELGEYVHEHLVEWYDEWLKDEESNDGEYFFDELD